MIKVLGAIRVSDQRQGTDGDSPEQQKQQIYFHANKIQVEVVDWVNCAVSATHPDWQPFVDKIVEWLKAHPDIKISYVLIRTIDRFTRGGGYVYQQMKARLAKFGVGLIDCEEVITDKKVNALEHLGVEYRFSTREPSLKAEIERAESARDYTNTMLTQIIGAEIIYTRQGYQIGPADFGYKSVRIETEEGRRYGQFPHEVEGVWVRKMYELRNRKVPDDEAVKEINKSGFKSRLQKLHDKNDRRKVIGHRGGVPLTRKQMNAYLDNVIYAGYKLEKWTNNKPVKMVGESIVTVEEWNKANEGKWMLYEENGEMKRVHYTSNRNKKKLMFNPEYPYKQWLVCHLCGKQVFASSPAGKLGKRHPSYHCNRGHDYWGISAKNLNEAIYNFAKNIKFRDDVLIRFKKIVLEEWNKMKIETLSESSLLNNKISEIDSDIKEAMEKIDILTNPELIKRQEKRIEEFENEKTKLMIQRDKKEQIELDVTTVINRVTYFLEHLEEGLLGDTNPLRRGSNFGSLFKTLPTILDLVSGTPEIRAKLRSHIILLNDSKDVKSLSCAPGRI